MQIDCEQFFLYIIWYWWVHFCRSYSTSKWLRRPI